MPTTPTPRPLIASRGAAAASLLATVLLCAQSCSFVAIQRAPSEPEAVLDEGCTDGFAYPAIDGVASVLGGVLAVALLSASGNEGARDDDPALRGAGYGSIGFAAIALASSAYGVVHVNRCRTARTEAGVRRPARDPVLDRPPPGTRGGPCLADDSCEGDLVCDPPMKTCIPIEPTEEDM